MSERARNLAEQFERATSDLLAFVGGCSASDWATTGHHRVDAHPLAANWAEQMQCVHESWSVGYVVHHIAEDQPRLLDWVQLVARGQSHRMVLKSLGVIKSQHAEHHARVGTCALDTPEQATDLLRRDCPRVESVLRCLTDAQLEQTTTDPLGNGKRIRLDDIAEHLLVGHIRLHRAGLRAVLGR